MSFEQRFLNLSLLALALGKNNIIPDVYTGFYLDRLRLLQRYGKPSINLTALLICLTANLDTLDAVDLVSKPVKRTGTGASISQKELILKIPPQLDRILQLFHR